MNAREPTSPGAKGSKSWWPWPVLGLVTLMILVGVRASIEWRGISGHGDSADYEPPPIRYETVDDVRIWGRADRSRLSQGDRMTLWLFIENRSDKAISDLRIDELRTPGFEPEGECWPAGCEPPGCAPNCRFATARVVGLPPSLEPGDSAGVEGSMAARDLQPGASVSASVSWIPANVASATGSPIRSRPATVTVGPFFPVETEGWFIVLLSSFYEVLKDLGLPIALAILAFLFKRLQSDRDQRRKFVEDEQARLRKQAEDEQARLRKQAEDEQARLRKQAEDERARRHQTYQSLLPRAHKNAVRYLLPMSLFAGTVSAQVASAVDATDSAAEELAFRRSFHALISLLKKNWNLLEKGGGFFLDSLAGEIAALGCWDAVFARTVDCLGYASLYGVIDRVEEDDTLTRFEKRFCLSNEEAILNEAATQPPGFEPHFVRARDRFRRWAVDATFADVKTLLELFSSITLFEVNRLYVLWYEESDLSLLQDFKQRIETLDWQARGVADLEKVEIKLRQYLKQTAGES